MATLLIRDLPPDLHQWLRDEAHAHHRSANRHTIALLENLRRGGAHSAEPTLPTLPAAAHKATLERLAALQRAIAAGRTANASAVTNESALGYNEHGLPT